MFVFGFIVGLLWRRPRHGHFTLNGQAILFAAWMTPWLLASGSLMSPWPFYLALLAWIGGWIGVRCWRNYAETK